MGLHQILERKLKGRWLSINVAGPLVAGIVLIKTITKMSAGHGSEKKQAVSNKSKVHEKELKAYVRA